MSKKFSRPAIDIGRNDDQVTSEAIGSLYFNHALEQIKQGRLPFAQQQLAQAIHFLPGLPEIVLLQLKVAVIQNDPPAATLYLQTLEGLGLPKEDGEHLRRRIIEVQCFRAILPIYAILNPFLELIAMIVRFVFQLVFKLCKNVASKAVYLARAVVKQLKKFRKRSVVSESTSEVDSDTKSVESDGPEKENLKEGSNGTASDSPESTKSPTRKNSVVASDEEKTDLDPQPEEESENDAPDSSTSTSG